jgi:hypothetical protein
MPTDTRYADGLLFFIAALLEGLQWEDVTEMGRTGGGHDTKRHTEEQIIAVLKHAQAGIGVAGEICLPRSQRCEEASPAGGREPAATWAVLGDLNDCLPSSGLKVNHGEKVIQRLPFCGTADPLLFKEKNITNWIAYCSLTHWRTLMLQCSRLLSQEVAKTGHAIHWS